MYEKNHIQPQYLSPGKKTSKITADEGLLAIKNIYLGGL